MNLALAMKLPIDSVVNEIRLIFILENDQLFPDEIREAGQKYLEEKQVKHEIKVYSDVPHGFAVVGEYSDPKIQQAQKEAFEQMLAWLKAH